MDRLHEGLYVDVWEHTGKWALTHQFNTGLELDSKEKLAKGSNKSRVHLPSTSLRALQQFRSSLQRQNAVALGFQARTDEGGLGQVLQKLVEKTQGALNSECRKEAWDMLKSRTDSCKEAGEIEDCETVSANSEQLVQPEQGREAVDVSVLTLANYNADEPVVAFAALQKPVPSKRGDVAPLRYIAIVFGSEKCAHHSMDVAKACAVTFMDESFAATMAKLTSDAQCNQVLPAVDQYLSSLTIVPTVFLDSGGGGFKELEDEICDRMESLMSVAKGIKLASHETKIHHHDTEQKLKTAGQKKSTFFVEIDELLSPQSMWRTTHRLRRGLEVDTASGAAKPHLPHVSATSLHLSRQLMTHQSVKLNVEVSKTVAAVETVLDQLKSAGMPAEATNEVSQALTDRVVTDVCVNHEDDFYRQETPSNAQSQLLRPEIGDEACHILVISCKKFSSSGIVGSFVRFKDPLSVYFPKMKAPARFLLVFVGPENKARELSTLGDSLAALATDEDLMSNLSAAATVDDFMAAVDLKLANLTVMSHTHVFSASDRKRSGSQHSSDKTHTDEHVKQEHHDAEHGHDEHAGFLQRNFPKVNACINTMQKFSVPLVTGVFLALAWSNIDEHSYHDVAHGHIGDFLIFGHHFSLHFFVNDIFMCFFFGLAIKEVTEALLPGGSLSPLKRAVNPLVATFGGVAGPALAYIIAILVLWSMGSFEGQMCVQPEAAPSGRLLRGIDLVRTERMLKEDSAAAVVNLEPCDLVTLIKGWGVPTATDISLAWMFALLIFGAGHPAINFLLLLAIVDDALGMAIIAICYPDPSNPVEIVYLLLVLLAMIVAAVLRKLQISRWPVYIFVAGPISWLGLIKAHVHPALALVFVVPFMPAGHGAVAAKEGVADLGAWDPSSASSLQRKAKKKEDQLQAFVAHHGEHHGDHHSASEVFNIAAMKAHTMMNALHCDSAPLHAFEHELKLPVDFGMFLFGFANAGVALDNVGGMTIAVLFALMVGKTIGIACMSLLAAKCGYGLPSGVTTGDLWSMSSLAGVGLTVALFVANEAFVDPTLQGQAKFAAVLSILSAGVAFLIHRFAHRNDFLWEDTLVEDLEDGSHLRDAGDCLQDDIGGVWNSGLVEERLVEDILQLMWMQKRYEKRGMMMPLKATATPGSLSPHGSRQSSKQGGSKRVPSKSEKTIAPEPPIVEGSLFLIEDDAAMIGRPGAAGLE